MNAASQAAFLAWVQDRHPSLFAKAAEQEGLDGLGAAAATSATPGYTPTGVKLFDSVLRLAPAYLNFDAQRRLFSQNLKAARAGQPPATSLQAPIAAPVTGASYGTGFMERLTALPLPVKIGAVAAVAFLAYSLTSRR